MTKDKLTPVIKLKSLTKRYGIGDAEQVALDGIDLTINKGEFIAIMGPSGCGKTTLLNILGLLDRPDEGTYHLGSKSVTNISSSRSAKIRNEKIGFVFQSFNLIPRLNVVENVALPLTYTGKSRIKSLEIASKTLEKFYLNEREYYMPHQLSGGQTQRVAIARALVNNPSIILADEPTGNLDSKASHIIMEELAAIHKQGNTIIMVTHNPDMTTYADRIITMIDGQIDSDTKDIKKDIQLKKEEKLGSKTESNIIEKPKKTESKPKTIESEDTKSDKKAISKPKSDKTVLSETKESDSSVDKTKKSQKNLNETSDKKTNSTGKGQE
jgi:hypothetical protein cdiviTM7_02659